MRVGRRGARFGNRGRMSRVGGCISAMSTWGWCECTWWEGDPGMVDSGSFMAFVFTDFDGHPEIVGTESAEDGEKYLN